MLRHGSLRDDRRRRTLLEDVSGAAEPGTAAKSRRASKAAEAYTALARSECHARWSDFVPLRNWTLATLFAAGVLPIAALETAYFFAAKSALWTSGALRALDLQQAGSLAGWLAALVMLSTAVLSGFIYSVRRYRLDDYRGRYRTWLWGAALWLAMSIDVVADLHGLVRVLGIELSGRVGPGDGILWWLAPWSVVLLWLGLRMAFDVRECRTAAASLALGFCGLIAGFVLPHMSLPTGAAQSMMIAAGCSLLGRWLLFFAHAAFARHVLLDAHGKLPVRTAERKPERKKNTEPQTEEAAKMAAKTPSHTPQRRDDLTTRVDPPHASNFRPATSGIDLQRPPVSVSALAPKNMSQFRDDDFDVERAGDRKLSRAERKRLRKLKRQAGGDDE